MLVLASSFTSSRLDILYLFFNISINFINILAVASASSTALWWFSKEISNFFAITLSVCLVISGKIVLDKPTVSKTVFSTTLLFLSAHFFINPISNFALWATNTLSSKNSKNLGNISLSSGASSSISSVILVKLIISLVNFSCGLIKVENLSIISPFFTLTAPISIILLYSLLRPVVSKSNITYLSSKFWFLLDCTTLDKSSTK